MQWLQATCPKLHDTPSPMACPRVWAQLAASVEWKGYLKDAASISSGSAEKPAAKPPSHIVSECFCYECGRGFATQTALRAHAAKMHGHINHYFRKVSGTS